MKKIFVLSACMLLASCGGSSEHAEHHSSAPVAAASGETPAQRAASAAAFVKAAAQGNQQGEHKDYFSDAQALQKAEDSLKALPAFGGKPLRFFKDIQFYNRDDAAIEIDIVDPNKPENVDHYTYSFKEGQWGPAQPVKLSGGGDMKANSTELSLIKFAQLADLSKVWREKAKEVSAKGDMPAHASFILFVPNQDRFWQTEVDTDRAQYMLRLKPDGSLKSFEK